MTKDKAYALTGLWALFMSLVHSARKYFAYKESGLDEMTEWKVLGLHFVATFGILLFIGILLVFVYFKFFNKKKE